MTTEMPATPAGHYRFLGVVRSEWTKFRTLRSSWLVLAAFAVLTIAIGIYASATSGSDWTRAPAESQANWDPTDISLTGLAIGALLLPVLGVLTMGGEYGSGSIRSTLAAVPRRTWVLMAKAIVFSAVAIVASEAVSFATFFVGQTATGAAPHASLGQPGVFRAVALSGAFLALMGLLGFGLGVIIRHNAWAIAAYVGLALVSPAILLPLPGNVWRFAPINILGNSVMPVRVSAQFLSPWTGLAVMGLCALAALSVGGILFIRRDA